MSHVDALVYGGSNIGEWHLAGFFGKPNTSLRLESWRLLTSYCGVSLLPWLVIGDFNEIISNAKKEGGVQRPINQMARFKNAIDFCGLKEVDFVGPKFTLLYQWRDGSQIRERLDRALVSSDRSFLFPAAKLFRKSFSTSDYSPLLLNYSSTMKKKKLKRVFRFESIWLKDQTCERVVIEAWDEGLNVNLAFSILSCMDSRRIRLEVWN